MPRGSDNSEILRYALRTFIAAVAILLLSSDRASACSHLWQSYKVKGDFVIEVSNGGEPLQGAEVMVFRKLDPPYVLKNIDSQISDREGLASIRGLAPGKYRILVRHSGITGEEVDVRVLSDPSSEQVRIKLNWPLKSALRTRDVVGAFYAGHEEKPLLGATLSLAQVFPDRPAIRVNTNMEGGFAFPSVAPGFYILTITEREDANAAHGVDGDIFIEVKNDASDSRLPGLLLTRTSCGLEYQPTKEKSH